MLMKETHEDDLCLDTSQEEEKTLQAKKKRLCENVEAMYIAMLITFTWSMCMICQVGTVVN